MGLNQEFELQGIWLFRWRSYLPLLLVTLVAVAYAQLEGPLQSHVVHPIWEFVCIAISLLGLLIRVVAGGYAPRRTSGRNTRRQVADELNTTGIYSVVRHPLYLGNFLIAFGVSLVLLVWWLPVIYTLAFWLYYERIMYAEESFLRKKFGDAFDAWAGVTPAFWPKPRLWGPATLPFSFRHALRREYTGLMIVVLCHTGIEFSKHIVLERRLAWEPFWIVFAVGGTMLYVIVRQLKRGTTLLDVAGRVTKSHEPLSAS